MKKWMGIAALGVIIIAAVVVIVTMQGRDRTPNAGQLDDLQPTATAGGTTEAANGSAESTNENAESDIAATDPVEADVYLKVEMIGLGLIFEPIPLTESRDIELPQPDGKLNIVRITDHSIEMIHSSCPGQECVQQGIVTLENRDQRPLMNMIICLPNQVILELLTPEEAAADMAGE